MEKFCCDCEVVKDITEFRKDSRKKSGYGSYCKPCSSKQAKKWQRDNPQKRKDRDEAWYQANKERKRAADEKRLPAYRERRREIDRVRYIANGREYGRERLNRWRRENNEHSLRYHQAWRALRRSQGSDWNDFPDSLSYVRLIINDPCVYCGGAAEAIDHIHPSSQGGGGTWDNLAPACMSCNSSKRDQDLLGFLLRTRDRRV